MHVVRMGNQLIHMLVVEEGGPIILENGDRSTKKHIL